MAPAPDKPESTETARERRRLQADIRARMAPLRKAVSDAEAMVARLGKKNEAMKQKLADPELYSGPADAIRNLQIEAGSLQNALANAEGEWLEAIERLETAEREARESA